MALFRFAGPAGIVHPVDNDSLVNGAVPCSGNVGTARPAPAHMWARVFDGDAPANPSDLPANPWFDGDPNNATREISNPAQGWNFSPLPVPQQSLVAGSPNHVIVWSVFPDNPSVLVPDGKNFKLGIALVPDSVQANFTLRGQSICDIFHVTLTRTPGSGNWSGTANSSCIQNAMVPGQFSFPVQMTCSVNLANGQLQVQIQVNNGSPAIANNITPGVGSTGSFSASWTTNAISINTLNVSGCNCVNAPALLAYAQ